MYGMNNSTYGNIYTIIGLIYLYFPFMLMPLYSVLNDMPRNYIYASHDLGYGG
jgi:spermidine/putrescine transport system permease protein